MIYSKKRDINETIERHIIIDCDCGTHLLKLTSFDDEDMTFLSIFSDNFYSKQKSPFYIRIWEKIKKVWLIISGKEYRLEEIVLTKKDIKDLIEALEQMEVNKK